MNPEERRRIRERAERDRHMPPGFRPPWRTKLVRSADERLRLLDYVDALERERDGLREALEAVEPMLSLLRHRGMGHSFGLGQHRPAAPARG